MPDGSRPPDDAAPGRRLSLRTIRRMYRLMPSRMFIDVMIRNGVSLRRVVLARSIAGLVYLGIIAAVLAGTLVLPLRWWPVLGFGGLGVLFLWEFLERRVGC